MVGHLGAAEVFNAIRGRDRWAVHAHATGLADALRARLGMLCRVGHRGGSP